MCIWHYIWSAQEEIKSLNVCSTRQNSKFRNKLTVQGEASDQGPPQRIKLPTDRRLLNVWLARIIQQVGKSRV